MAADNWEELLDFEGNIEAAAVGFIGDVLDGVLVTRMYDQDVYSLPRVGVAFELSEALDPPDGFDDDDNTPGLIYRKHVGLLSVSIFTDATQAGSDDTHRTIRAKVRNELLLTRSNFDATTLPLYNTLYLRPSAHIYQSDGDLVQTTIQYTMHFSIRDDAWPVVVTTTV